MAVINIPDANLKKALNTLLGQDIDADITQEQMESFSGTIDISSPDDDQTISADDITDLTGIGYAKNTTTLRVNNHAFENVDALLGMDSLQKFYAFYGTLEDVNGFKDLPKINYLNIRGNKISDLKPFKGKTAIKTFYIDNNNISDLNPLSDFTYLDLLNIEKNHITDLRPVKNATIKSFYAENQTYEKDFGSADHTEAPSLKVYDRDGTEIDVDFGTPVIGVKDYNGTWSNGTKYTGTVTLKNYGYTSNLQVDLNRPTFDLDNTHFIEYNETKTDEELKTLFNIRNISDNKDTLTIDDIKVDSSEVQYGTPGNYKVIFTLVDSDTNTTIRNAILTINDKPKGGSGITRSDLRIDSNGYIEGIERKIAKI